MNRFCKKYSEFFSSNVQEIDFFFQNFFSKYYKKAARNTKNNQNTHVIINIRRFFLRPIRRITSVSVTMMVTRTSMVTMMAMMMSSMYTGCWGTSIATLVSTLGTSSSFVEPRPLITFGTTTCIIPYKHRIEKKNILKKKNLAR